MHHSKELSESLEVAPRGLRGEVNLECNVHIEQRRNGQVIDVRDIHNLITNAGKAFVAGLINGSAGAAFENIAIGTGTTAANAADTALETEITTNGGARAADGTPTRTTTTVTNDTATVDVTYTFSGSFAVTESGLFDQTTVGGSTMLARQTFSALNVVSGDSLTVTWKIKVS